MRLTAKPALRDRTQACRIKLIDRHYLITEFRPQRMPSIRVPYKMKSAILFSGVCIALFCCTGCGPRSSGYQKSGGHWSYVSMTGNGLYATDLGADSETFVVFNPHGYAKDKQTVWYSGTRVRDIDAASFVALPGETFGRDNLHVFIRGHVIPGADPDTYAVIGGPYGRDKSSVFCGNVKMRVQNINLFEVVVVGLWTEEYDKEHFVLAYGDEFADLEVSRDNPAVLACAWGRDGTNYYCGPARLKGADYQTLKVDDLGFGSAQDRNRKYIQAFSEDEYHQRQEDAFQRRREEEFQRRQEEEFQRLLEDLDSSELKTRFERHGSASEPN
ncbi:MAG: hypothetical protein C0483_04960 [Pirellula sp.]|nr:hypothetical protein [Pirellula sp.]